MSEIAVEAVYFKQPGPKNTARTLEIARRRADVLGIKSILVASIRGWTGAQAVEIFEGYHVVVVTESTGYFEPNSQALTDENRTAIAEAGGTILTCQQAMGGISRAVRHKLGTYLTDEIIAYTLRNFGQGVKVCVEIALMAADAGLVSVGKPCIAIAGTAKGADTAMVLTPANAQRFFDLRVLEILCKPRLA